MCLCACTVAYFSLKSPHFFLLICNSTTKLKKCSYCKLFVPINQFLLFVSCTGMPVSAGLWLGSEGAPDTVVNMLSSGFYHLQLLRSAASVCRSGCAGEQACLIRSLLFPSRPNWSQAHLSAHDHATTHFAQMLDVEQNTVTFFFTTQENGCGKLVGWNILKVEDVNITSADVCCSVRNTDTWDQITA